MTGVPPHDLEAEQAVLGAVLLAQQALTVLCAETNLRAEHFYGERHRVIFTAMLSLQDEGRAVDATTVCAELRRVNLLDRAGGEPYVHTLPTLVPSLAGLRTYAEVVARTWLWRVRREVGHEFAAAAERQDEDAYATAEQRLHRAADTGHDSRFYTREQLGEDFFELLSSGGVEAFPFPFEELTNLTSGGMRRGGLTLIGGHTSHGKSSFLDQCLEHASLHGLATCLYINEMDHQERTARTLARATAIDADRLLRAELTDAERQKVVVALSDLPFSIADAPGWSALDIARHTRHHGYDLVAVDLLHGVPYQSASRAEGLGEVSRQLKQLAGVAQCHVLAAVHLNEARVQGVVRPHPMLGDIRDSGQPKNDADNVIFVYREQDPDTGYPQPEGLIYLSKCRGGRLGSVQVAFNGRRMRFSEDPRGYGQDRLEQRWA